VRFDRPETVGEDRFHLVVYPTYFGDGSGANRPHLQETPNPNTTVTWNSWIEINPETADRLGIHNDDIVRVRSEAGEIEVIAYLYPAIRPDVVAIPFGQGHTALGRYAEGRGVNPARLLAVTVNEAGDLAFADTIVTLEATGRRRPLARIESETGVYGKH
jgi:anaerobic selenocysteine-containing dehydrogenase